MALGAYVLYVKKNSLWKLVTAVSFYAMALMSKPMLVSLPFLFLLFDYWPLKRLDPGKMSFKNVYSPYVKEKIPFFLLSAASCIITIVVQYKANTLMNVEGSPIELRAANAFVSYVAYLLKTLWPVNLAVLYPYPDSLPYMAAACAFLFIIGTTVLIIMKAEAFPYLFVGWFWYVLTLLPVIGFVRVGFQAMADRYTYIPLIGISIIFSWLISDLLKKRMYGYALPILAGILIIILCPLTWKQTAYWKNSITLYEHALSVTEKNYVVLNNLGVARFEKGEYQEALDLFSRSLKIHRNNPHPFFYTGHILSKQGSYQEAIPYFQYALMLKPNYKNARTELGICF